MPAVLAEFKETLFALLGETFEQVQGIYLDRGTSLFETLATITSDEASRPVSAQCATLAAQVKHVRFYLDVLEDFIRRTPRQKVDWGEIWRTTSAVSPEEWETLKAELRTSYQRICQLLQSLDTWEGENEVAGALAIVVHTAYHLGEIRQALCTLKQR